MQASTGYLRLQGVTKAYGDAVAVSDLDLTAHQGELISLLGPSGCGKTTTLRMIAGFLHPDAGEIQIDGKQVAGVPSHKRETAMVFQNYALFPHMSVLDNVAFGLKMRRVPTKERRERAAEVLDLVRLPRETHGRFPTEISGGQQQRVALARALIVEPKLLLLDEPLSNLDAKLRKQLRTELREIHDRVGTTTVFVTHDLEEAFELSDRIAVMNAGVVEQVATPGDLYRRPATPFVADFVGHVNLLRGTTKATDGGLVFVTEPSGLVVPLPEGTAQDVTSIVIPEARVRVADEAMATATHLEVDVKRASYRGRLRYLVLKDRVSGQCLETHIDDELGDFARIGETVHVGWDPCDVIPLAGGGS